MTREDYYGLGNVSTHNNWNNAAATDMTETSVTAKKTRVLSIDVENQGTSPAFLRLYDKASAPVVGTDQPKQTFMVPAGGGKVNEKNMAMEFASGLAYAVTSDGGPLGSIGVTNANEVVVNLEYFDKF